MKQILFPLITLFLTLAVAGCYLKARLTGQAAQARQARRVVARGCVGELGRELPRHPVFGYCTRGSLGEGFFQKARAARGDGWVYLLLSRSESPAGQVIGLFTHRAYNHVSLALDEGLETLVSYNGGEPAGSPGLNPETLEELLRRPGSAAALYRLKATPHQKQILLRRLDKLNREGSAYNLPGLVTGRAWRENTMFCSQFVYAMLRLAGLHYFRKSPLQVRPTDFVEWDHFRRLTLLREYTHADLFPSQKLAG